MSEDRELTEEEKTTVEEKLRVLTNPAPETPIDKVDPRHRLGQLFRRFRIKAGKNLRETAEALKPSIESTVVLGEIERGRRPATAEQIQDFCNFIGVGTVAFYDAARDYHRSVWQEQEHALTVVEQTAKVSSTGPSYDQQELVSALRSAISSMDIASELLARCARILTHERTWVRDGEMAASAALMLDGGANYARRILKFPLQRPFAENPPDWEEIEAEADAEEKGSDD